MHIKTNLSPLNAITLKQTTTEATIRWQSRGIPYTVQIQVFPPLQKQKDSRHCPQTREVAQLHETAYVSNNKKQMIVSGHLTSLESNYLQRQSREDQEAGMTKKHLQQQKMSIYSWIPATNSENQTTYQMKWIARTEPLTLSTKSTVFETHVHLFACSRHIHQRRDV